MLEIVPLLFVEILPATRVYQIQSNVTVVDLPILYVLQKSQKISIVVTQRLFYKRRDAPQYFYPSVKG